MSDRTIEDEFEDLLVAAYRAAFGKDPSDAHLLAMSMRAGTKGTVRTLAETGDAIGVTRERVQQIMAQIAPHLRGAELPGLTMVAEELVRRSPVADPIGRLLSRSGLTRPTLTGSVFFNFLNLIGTTATELVGTDLVRLEDWIIEESNVPVVKALPAAKKHTSRYGMTTVEEIRQAIATPENPLDPQDIRRVLRSEPSVKWQGEWLWVEKDNESVHANRLINTARSILSVNSPQTVASIHEGARRVWKFRGLDILAPVEAMRGFFQASPYFIVEGDLVRPVELVDYHELLGGVAATMIDVLKSSPYQVMDRQSLTDACLDAGIARGTFGTWTSYAEWMEKVAPNVWGLRGSNPNPGAVEEIRRAANARSKAEPRRKSWAWAPDGTVVQTMDVTTSLLGAGVLSFDPDIHNLLAGQSLAVYKDGQPVATAKLGADHKFCWGWHPALAALGVKKGDVLQIRVNVAARTAKVRSGGQELWD
jgi:hypothetical protein